jgi:hypothetical protein
MLSLRKLLCMTLLFATATTLARPIAALPARGGPVAYTFTTTAPGGADKLCLVFTGTGGSIGCINVLPAPMSATSPAGNDINVMWPAKLAMGTAVTVTFTASFGGVQFNSGNWKCGATNVAPVSGTVSQAVPALGTWGFAALVLLALAGGSLILVRRS